VHPRQALALLWRALPFLRPVRWQLGGVALVASVLAAVTVPLGLLLLDLFFTRVLQGEPLTVVEAALLRLPRAETVSVEVLAPGMRREIAERTLLVGLVVATPIWVIGVMLWYWVMTLLQRVNQHVRLLLLDRLQALSLRWHAESRVGDAVYRLYQDSAMVTQVLTVLLIQPTLAIGGYGVSVLVVGVVDPRLALVLVLASLPCLLVGGMVSARLRARFATARAANSALTATVQELVAGLRVLKAYGAEGRALERFAADSHAAFGTAYGARGVLAGFDVALFWIVGGALLAATAWATLATRDGDPLFARRLLAGMGFTAWNLGVFTFVRGRFGAGTDALRALFGVWARTQDVVAGLSRVFDVLDRDPEVSDAPDAVALEDVRRGITFDGVDFAYGPGRPVLHGVRFTARVGALTALVGPSGAGKSTALALLLRLYDPDAGAIRIDERDLRTLRIDTVRQRVALVLQAHYLFGATVRENVALAVPGATDAEVAEVLRLACADDFVGALPDGWNTVLGTRGTKLSSGQRQRLAIARALLKDAPILVLDEPTAALDPETERRVLENLRHWGRERVILIVTHRPATIRLADEVVVLRAGRVVEAGAPSTLLAQDGAFRALVSHEAG
jgi:ABC-type multidrug transport system fused ATPase/permease subunit